MSYRTKINGFELFGNNECHKEWLDYIKTQGITVTPEGSYKGELTDFMSALVVIEQMTLRLNKERELMSSKYTVKHLFDWSDIPSKLSEQSEDDKYGFSLLDKLFEIVNNGYAFLPYTFYLACRDKLERDKCFSTPQHFDCFKLKEGEKILVEGG